MTPNNPLRQYFRQPSIYIRLPSQGNFYPQGALDMPPNGEIPVLPMTAVDEISYRTPDALFNGAAMVDVIQSCMPNIRNAWAIPAMDVDAILVGIRVASYGHEMDVTSQCPGCNNEHDFTVDLRSVLDQLSTPDYSIGIQQGDLEVYFRPMTYQNLNQNNQLQFEQQKMMSMLPESDLGEEDKIRNITDALKRLTAVTIEALCQSIAMIRTPSAMVTEPEFIHEFMQNCDRKVFNLIRDRIVELKAASEIKPMTMTCPECQTQYEQGLTLDMTSFFGVAS